MPRTSPAILPDGLPAGHPLREAQWIWPGATTYLNNCFAHFRRDFELPKARQSTPFNGFHRAVMPKVLQED